MAAFKALTACYTMLRNRLYGGSFLSSEIGPVMTGLLCHVFIWVEKIIKSLSSHSIENCRVKNESTVTFLPPWPHSCRYALSPILTRPWLIAAQILHPHSSIQIGYDSIQHGAWFSWHSRLFCTSVSCKRWEWPCQFCTIQNTFKCSCYWEGLGWPVFLEEAVSILDLSVPVLAVKLRLKNVVQAIPYFIIY